MVTVILRGGLGNQMFQYAAGLDLALKNGAKLVLDKTYLNDRFPRRQFTKHENKPMVDRRTEDTA